MTTTRPEPPPASGMRQAPLTPVGAAVHKRIKSLQRGYLDDRSDAVAALARLRRGIGRAAGELPDLWGLIGAEDLYELYQRQELTEDAMRRAEEAAHAAVTLWSLHQQSHHTARMHRRPGLELGAAVRRLAPGTEIDEPTRKRFVRAGTAADSVVLAGRLRDLVLLMRREAVPLDYGLLADQLYLWQSPGGPQAVRRSWGRSYLAVRRPASGDSTGPAGQRDPDGPPGPGDPDGPQAPDPTTSEDDTP